ncbi:NADH-dependent flavin oxidoreductase [Hutsoniella sourekii]|uniref:NADH-dependent flavin oxidoreductase n=1 Tax=Hutsoniella sourekii TaxID=87650 RepID=UPI0004878110|nr:NADH-dependent flavin oxidoreductase [Hutsoniella sourekii]
MTQTYQALFEPIKLPNGLELANRFSVNPITTNSSTREGYITEEDLAYARRRAQSAPLHITTAAYIEDYGQLFEYGPSIRNDRFIPGLSQWAEAIQGQGAKGIIQLTHAGRFAKTTLQDYGLTYGPSHMQLQTPVPHQSYAMSKRKIKHVIDQYQEATRRAIQAGFAGVEISNAQRLLPQQFFSKFSNQREDEYGGQSLEDRARFGVEVMAAVQEAVDQEGVRDSFIIGFRGTPEEVRGNQIGYSVDEFNQYVDWLLEVSQVQYYAIASWGHNIYQNTVRAQGPHTGQLVNQVVHDHFRGRLPIIATGGINTPQSALEALEHADMVGLSSVFVTEPDFVLKLLQGKEDQIDTGLTPDKVLDLAIPGRAFKDLVEFFDLGGSLDDQTRDELRRLADQAEVSYFKDYQ